ncbi:MAG: MBL fold metallo-hydrolase [Alphaproteobacteria bacterium]|nr:MBL fold metallo-hydrolase [Alphaproteobacteria bacterium]
MAIAFDRSFSAPVGEPIQVSSRITRVLAPNPGPFTFHGTGTYIIGRGRDVAIIDPGPASEPHIEALKRAVAGRRLTHILITHTHSDHSPAAAPLKAWSGAKTYGFGPHGSGQDSTLKLEEGGDRDFVPDILVRDGDEVEGDGFSFECVFTPGHTSNHMCFALRDEDALFTGDHVMGWSTTVVIPPDGNMAEYMASLRKLIARHDQVLWPTHGGPVRTPRPFLEAYLAHRLEREAQIVAALERGLDTIPKMVTEIYAAVDRSLHPAAARSVEAHLIQLEGEGRVLRLGQKYQLA